VPHSVPPPVSVKLFPCYELFLSNFIPPNAPLPCPQMSAKNMASSPCPSSLERRGLCTNEVQVLIDCGIPWDKPGLGPPSKLSYQGPPCNNNDDKTYIHGDFFYIENLLHLTGSPRPHTVEMRKQVSRRASGFGQGPSLRLERWSLNPKSSKAKAWAPSFITQQMKMTALLNWGRHPLLPQGHWLMSGHIFVCHKLGRRASTGYWHLVS